MLLKSWKSAALALSAMALVTAAPAQARDGYYRGHNGGDDAAIAIGAGVVGLALGAALASGSRDRDYYYDDGYYYNDGYNYPRGYQYRSYPRHYRNYDYDYPRYRNYQRGWNGWRGDRHDGWSHRNRWNRGDGWGRGNRGERRWRY